MILEMLKDKGKLNVFVTRPVVIYTKCLDSYSECWDRLNNCQLDVDNIDDSYCLDSVQSNDKIDVYIPSGAMCILEQSGPNTDCKIVYKNIECELLFDGDPIDQYFDIIED